ncbi:MAG: ABC transporter ATP-binding protein [Chlamydiota bacterium]
MPEKLPALTIKNFTKNYGSQQAVCDLSFELYPGEVFGLLGPNGAGKTTLISALVTLQQPSSGSIEVFGFDLAKQPKQAKRLIGFVPQELVNYSFFTVIEILRYHATYYGIRFDKQYLEYLLVKLDLQQHRKKQVKELSGGMKRRLLIVKALLHRPKLLLLDEPTAGVDVELRAALWQFIQELKEEKIAILLTTHYLEEAERLCDRIGVLDQGRLRRIDRTENLLREHSSKKVTLILAHPVPKISHPLLSNQSDYHLDFQMPNDMPLLKVLAEALVPLDSVRDVNVKVGTLEDVMENLLHHE